MTEPNDRSFVNSTTPEKESDADEAMSSKGAVAKVISTRTGLLDLPPEIRLMIFRHLLVRQIPLPGVLPHTEASFPDLSILRTSKLIHQEAFDVFYKENRFHSWFWKPPFPVSRFPRIVNTIQNIETDMTLGATFSDSKKPRGGVAAFVRLMQCLENHSIIRRKLVLTLYIDPSPHSLKWLVGALGRFTNFRTINLHLLAVWFRVPHKEFFEWCEHLKTALKPVLGYAEEFEISGWNPSAIGLRFHPVDYQNQSREPSRRESSGLK